MVFAAFVRERSPEAPKITTVHGSACDIDRFGSRANSATAKQNVITTSTIAVFIVYLLLASPRHRPVRLPWWIHRPELARENILRALPRAQTIACGAVN